MKTKIILLFVLTLGTFQLIVAQEESQRIGFAGLIASVTPNNEFGGGIEVGTFKKYIGIGFQAEYIPAPEPHLESSTFARAFLLFKITKNLFIKPSAGIEAKNVGRRSEFQNESFFNFGIGPLFAFEKCYFGFQPNLSYSSYKGLNFSTGSVVIGYKFK